MTPMTERGCVNFLFRLKCERILIRFSAIISSILLQLLRSNNYQYLIKFIIYTFAIKECLMSTTWRPQRQSQKAPYLRNLNNTAVMPLTNDFQDAQYSGN